MAHLLIRGAELRYDDMRREETTMFHRLHFTADLSKTLAEEMDWDILGDGKLRDGIGGGILNGSRSLESVAIIPVGMKQHTLEFLAGEIRDFRLKVKDNEGGAPDIKITFVIVSNDKIARLVEDYMDIVGQAAAQVKCKLAGGQQMKLADASIPAPSVEDASQ